ncbi:MAG: serine--tRNA ligase [Roseburia sp.]
MIDLKFLRENPEIVKENIKKKFQDHKLPLVDQVIELDEKARAAQQEADALRANRNTISKQIGVLMKEGKKDEAMVLKEQVAKDAERLAQLEEQEKDLQEQVTKIMMTIPNIIDPSVPIGKDDSCNVEIEKFGEPVVPDFEIPYHTEIMEKFNGIDLDAAGKVAGNGFYYLMGDIARLHSAVISYARDFMIDRGFTYCVPPFMIRSNVVTGVMSFDEMDAMMYKIEGEDLYLIGTSEHSMIGKFIDTINDEENLPYTLTSYSPCFRKEKGAHGIEERGVYRIHQFEKQEMIVVCKPEESKIWYDKLWQNTVDLFRSLDIPVRTLECCSGDLADLKVKSCDVEAWSPRQKKYFEVGSCSNLGDAQARRLKIRVKGKDKNKYFAHTLNNTVVAPPRMLIAFLENNLNADGSVNIPVALRPYMGGKEKLIPTGNK